MCGIAGLLNLDGEPVDRAVITAMTRSLVHRGPDGEGVWVHGRVALGHRRLAIRDLSDAGRQPMHDETGRISVTYNGEIYNDAALRRELEREHGVRFHSTCDAEIIPAGYRVWGTGLFDRIEGMFAVALWDREREQLVLARDAAGIKPLYVWTTAERVVFGSEVKALLKASATHPRLKAEAIHAFLAQGYVSASDSLLEDIGQLPPATVRIISRDGVEDRCFWRPTRRPTRLDADEAVTEFLRLWDVVVNDLMVSDVPVGVLQSGGLDSSLIAAQLGRSQRTSVPLFTGAFPGRTHDEAPAAAVLARRVGLPHHPVPISEDADAEHVFRSVVHHFDGQLADSSGYAVFQLTREVRRHVPVVLSGDGADEFFGGYPTYGATRVASALRPLVPKPVSALAGRWALRSIRADESRLSRMEVLGRFLLGLSSDSPEIHPEWRRLLYGHLISDLYGPAMRAVEHRNPLGIYADAIAGAEGTLIDRCLLADQQLYLPADMLMKIDAMSMAHGLEVRVPFLDRRIMDFAGSLDVALLTPPRGPRKRVLHEALARMIPPDAVPKVKRGFNTPVAALLRTGLRPLAERLLGTEGERLSPWLDARGVKRLWEAHRDRRANHGYAVWSLLTLAAWLEGMESSPAPAAPASRAFA